MAGSTQWILWSRDSDPTARRMSAAASLRRAVAVPAGRQLGAAASPEATPEASPEPVAAPSADAAAPRRARRRRRGSQPEGSGRDLGDINAVIDTRCVDVVFQPVVDAEFEQVVGFEALARGPVGPLNSPSNLFAAARAVGRAGEIDWICRALAFQKFMDADLPASLSLFVNVEPDSLIEPCPEDLLPIVWEAETRLRVFIDIPGRAMSRHPREVVQTVRRARAAVWGVSVDDTEFSLAGISLLPLVEPDVVRLHHGLLHMSALAAPNALSAAFSEVHYGNATLLVENVEDPAARRAGLGIGATFQQGHLFGREQPLPRGVRPPRRTIHLRDHAAASVDAPFDLVRDAVSDRVQFLDTDGLRTLGLALIHQAASLNPVPVVAAVWGGKHELTPEQYAAYRML
ncbi:MAG TPA: EAL domain-containing protein, partial [Acidothermaceae bacterium]|nr:EAL domain-containing protein [Acidothermaceae bacterium]